MSNTTLYLRRVLCENNSAPEEEDITAADGVVVVVVVVASAFMETEEVTPPTRALFVPPTISSSSSSSSSSSLTFLFLFLFCFFFFSLSETKTKREKEKEKREREEKEREREREREMQKVKEKSSKEAVLLGTLVVLMLCSVFGWLLFLVRATPGQYYPGETDCDVQSSAQFDGEQTLLYCPNTKFISNLTLYDLNLSNLGHIIAYFYSSKPLFFPNKVTFQYSFDWWYDVRVGNETYYWSFLLNENSTLILNATLQYPIHLEVYFNYRQIDSQVPSFFLTTHSVSV